MSVLPDDEEVLRAFAPLTARERQAVLRLCRALARDRTPPVKPKRVVVTSRHGYAACGVCGEHGICYEKKGVMRCAACRRRANREAT